MRYSLLPTVLLGLSTLLSAYGQEVSESFEVTANGQKTIVQSGTTTNLLIDGKKVALSVRQTDFKKFDDGNISFLFPADHAVLKETNDTILSWTFDGQDTVIMLHRLKDLSSTNFAGELVEGLTEKYGEDSKVTTSRCQFGTQTVRGKTITAKVIDEIVVQEIYALPGKSFEYVVVLQNSGEKETDEMRIVKAKLKETFLVRSAPAATPAK